MPPEEDARGRAERGTAALAVARGAVSRRWQDSSAMVDSAARSPALRSSLSSAMKLAPIVLLLGPSGTGKSRLREWIRDDLGFIEHELDTFEAGGPNGVDRAGLRAQWDRLLLQGDADPLAREMRSRAAAANKAGAVLSIPSLVVLPPETIAGTEKLGVFTFILMGRREECRAAFLERQKTRAAAAVSGEHWDRHAQNFEAFESGLLAPYRLWTFRQGVRVRREELVESVRKRIGLSGEG